VDHNHHHGPADTSRARSAHSGVDPVPAAQEPRDATTVIGPEAISYGRHAAPPSAYGPSDVHRVLPEASVRAWHLHADDGSTPAADQAVVVEVHLAAVPDVELAVPDVEYGTPDVEGAGPDVEGPDPDHGEKKRFWARLRLLPNAA
jgi:hypothetical protein